jgi:ferredoxin
MTVQTTVHIQTVDGQHFEVEPGEIVLDAAMRQAVDIPYSCRSGTCRTCLSKVLSGRIEHEEEYADDLMISPEEVGQGFRLLCSSLALEDSVVEPGW